MNVDELPALVTMLLMIELLLTAAGTEVEFAAIARAVFDYLIQSDGA